MQPTPFPARALACALAFVLGACGGDSPTKPDDGTPNPPPNPTPAAIAITAGNNQEALPGTQVSVAPKVVVKNSDGAALPNVIVTFTVDSGGGSVQTSTATTTADGTASPGSWTLGTLEGRNVLLVKAGSLSPVKLVAIARVQPVTVPGGTVSAAGGTVTLSLPGSQLNGTTVTVPAGAVSGTGTIAFNVSSAATVTMPQGISALTPGLSISGLAGALAQPAIVTMPVTPGAGKILAAAVVEPNGALSVLPTVSRTANSMTFALGAFDNSKFGQASTMSDRFAGITVQDQPKLFVVGIDPSRLERDFDSGFRPGVDDWDFQRQLIASFPVNVSDGVVDPASSMVATSIWYFSKQKAFGGKLNAKYQEAKGVSASSRRGLRWVSVAEPGIPRLWAPGGTAGRLREAYMQDPKDAAEYNMDELKAAFLLSGDKPQPALIFATDNINDSIPRFGIAYRVVGNSVDLAIPDVPGQQVRIALGDNGWTPAQVTTAGNVTYTINFVAPIHYYIMVDDGKLTSQYLQVNAGTIGDAQGWPVKPQLHSKFGVHDTASMYLLEQEQHWWECAQCPDNGFRNPQIEFSPTPTHVVLFNQTARNSDGSWNPLEKRTPFGADRFSLASLKGDDEATVGHAIYLPGKGSASGTIMNLSWLDWITVRYRKLPTDLTPDTVFTFMDTTVNYSAAVTGAPTGIGYRFLYRGNVVDSTDKTVNTYSRKMDEFRTSKMYVTILEKDTKRPIGRDSAVVIFAKMWRFTQATLGTIELPPGGIGDEKTDTTILDIVTSSLNTMTQSPAGLADFRLHVVTHPTDKCQWVILSQSPAGAASDTGYVPTTFRAHLGSNCIDPDFNQNLTLNGTQVIGEATDVSNPSESKTVPGGLINATRNGRTIQGYLIWKVRYSTGIARYRVNFSGTLVVPP